MSLASFVRANSNLISGTNAKVILGYLSRVSADVAAGREPAGLSGYLASNGASLNGLGRKEAYIVSQLGTATTASQEALALAAKELQALIG